MENTPQGCRVSGTFTSEIISSVEVLKTALAPISRGVLLFDLEALDRWYGVNDALGREVESINGMTSKLVVGYLPNPAN